MAALEADIMADILQGEDRGEDVGMMEPLLIGEAAPRRTEMVDLALDLTRRSTALRSGLPSVVADGLAGLVRAMNCYYSNLIEGHDTHPVDIERALRGDYSSEPEKRDLQLEAKAHIAVQAWIDDGGLGDRILTGEGLRELHARFCENLPERLLMIQEPGTGASFRMTPGAFRQHDVKVGRHLAISAGAVPRFVARLERAYAKLGVTDTILAAATAHHRLLWIHPFLDGNGRVARLMSYALLRRSLDTGGLWSVARGLARNEALYKQHLTACDLPRRHDRDGRGNLSEECLSDFTAFFLRVCIDQVDFMAELIRPERLTDRIVAWAREEIARDILPARADVVLQMVLYRGELPRNEVAGLLGVVDRQARRVTSALQDRGVLVSEGPRLPWRLAFPAALAPRWMPGLFPEMG